MIDRRSRNARAVRLDRLIDLLTVTRQLLPTNRKKNKRTESLKLNILYSLFTASFDFNIKRICWSNLYSHSIFSVIGFV